MSVCVCEITYILVVYFILLFLFEIWLKAFKTRSSTADRPPAQMQRKRQSRVSSETSLIMHSLGLHSANKNFTFSSSSVANQPAFS